MSLYINPSDPCLKAKINNLTSTPGYCIFTDIVGSTELKDKNLSEWIISIYNTFSNIRFNLYQRYKPLKSIGDCLMFFIPDNELIDLTPLHLYAGLCDIINNDESYFKDVKISATYCKNTYDITFIEDTKDIYGKDIDLTACLLSIAESNEIIMNIDFVDRVRKDYKIIGNQDQFPEVKKIKGPWPQKFKGFNEYIEIYKTMK